MHQDQRPSIIIPVGTFLLSLLEQNPVNVVAAIDYRCNGALEKAGIENLTSCIHKIGSEKALPIFSIASNRRYYQRLGSLLDNFIQTYPDCRFILSVNYTPFSRFIIDRVGSERVELWEDGLNHYIKIESLLKKYTIKEAIKALSGFYLGGLFNDNYHGDKIVARDRFKHKNLNYKFHQLDTGKKYYIGQPLIEDRLISEHAYKEKLTHFFPAKGSPRVVYLPHPREEHRDWIADHFEIIQLNCSAEEYLIREGASAIYSAFSTVNVNLSCDKNVFLASYLGLDKIANRLKTLDFNVTLL